MQIDVLDVSTTDDGLPSAVLRLRPRQLPSFCLTLTAVAAVTLTWAASLPSTTVPAPTLPISPAGSSLSRRRHTSLAGALACAGVIARQQG